MQLVRAAILPKPRVTPKRIALGFGIGIIALCIVQPGRSMHGHGTTKTGVARIAVRKFAFEALPQWQQAHHAVCPHDIVELTPYMNSDEVRDPWGQRFVLVCDATNHRVAVISRGPDGEPNDDDDDGSGNIDDIVASW